LPSVFVVGLRPAPHQGRHREGAAHRFSRRASRLHIAINRLAVGAPEHWRFIGPLTATPAAALSEGVALLDAAGPDDAPTIVWWVVDDEALVLGRGSKVEADHDACRGAGVTVLRRMSGGGPVLWHRDLIALDVVVPRGHRLHSDDVVASYRWLGEAVAEALGTFGLAARVIPPDEARAANDPELANLACFAGRSPWEVVVDDRKVLGLSQVRRRGGTLLQAGIELSPPGRRLAELLRLDAAQRSRLDTALGAPNPGGDDVPTARIVDAVKVSIAALHDALWEVRRGFSSEP